MTLYRRVEVAPGVYLEPAAHLGGRAALLRIGDKDAVELDEQELERLRDAAGEALE